MKDATPPPFDERPFVRLDHGMPENPKMVRLSDAAFRLYIEALCLCSRTESDGFVPAAMMKRLARRPKSLAELVPDPFAPVDGGYVIHDYLAHQRSASEITAFRESRSARGTKGNHMRWHVARRRPDTECEYCIAAAIAEGSHQGSLSPSLPIADTDSDADTERSSISPSVVGDGDQFQIDGYVPPKAPGLAAGAEGNVLDLAARRNGGTR